ncbi:MAG: hypothetical protein ACUVX8_03710 [Candidatus Zipacnadales bacterium]
MKKAIQQQTGLEEREFIRRQQKRLRVDVALALLIIAGLIVYMGVVWWFNPPRWEAVTIREYVLRVLDAGVLIVLVAVWIVTPFVGLALAWPPLRDLGAHAVIAYRRRKRKTSRQLRRRGELASRP